MKYKESDIKKCYNTFKKEYRVYRSERNEDVWKRFFVNKQTLKELVKSDFRIGFDLKLHPYKFYWVQIIRWFLYGIYYRLKNWISKRNMFKLSGSVILIFLAILTYFGLHPKPFFQEELKPQRYKEEPLRLKEHKTKEVYREIDSSTTELKIKYIDSLENEQKP
jgi:hypothetical protein